MKRIGDWMYALGVNTLDPHLSYVSIRGARKRDHPQSFSYHEPWWNAYEASASYFARLSLALSQGEQIHQTQGNLHDSDSTSQKQPRMTIAATKRP